MDSATTDPEPRTRLRAKVPGALKTSRAGSDQPHHLLRPRGNICSAHQQTPVFPRGFPEVFLGRWLSEIFLKPILGSGALNDQGRSPTCVRSRDTAGLRSSGPLGFPSEPFCRLSCGLNADGRSPARTHSVCKCV